MEDLQGFLDRFPGGIYTDLARRRLRKLGVPTGGDLGLGSNSRITPLDITSLIFKKPVQVDTPPSPSPSPSPSPLPLPLPLPGTVDGA